MKRDTQRNIMAFIEFFEEDVMTFRQYERIFARNWAPLRVSKA